MLTLTNGVPCGCAQRKDIMFTNGKPGKAEVFILMVSFGSLALVAMPKLGASPKLQGILYGMVIGKVLEVAVNGAFDRMTNDDPDPIN